VWVWCHLSSLPWTQNFAKWYYGSLGQSSNHFGDAQPTNVHILRSFIELCNYYKIYVQDFSIIVHPLYALLKKDVTWTWSEEAQEAFNTFKDKFSKFPILKRLDFSKVFILQIDWFSLGNCATISQLDEEDKEYVIAYASRNNNKVESNYFSYNGECLVVVWAIIYFKP
jgi:hypothetical protein